MLQVRISCPSCRASMSVNHPWAAGAAVLCPHCQSRVDLPDARRFAAPAAEYGDPSANSTYGMPQRGSSTQQPYPPDAAGFGNAYGQVHEPRAGSHLFWILGAAAGGMVGVLAVVVLIVVASLRSSDKPEVAIPQAVAAAPSPPPVHSEAGAATANPAAVPPSSLGATSTASAPGATAPAMPAGNAPVAASAVPTATAISLPPQPALPLVPQPQAGAAALNYRWNASEDYAYFFKITADIAGVTDESTGMITLKTSNQPATANEFSAPVPIKQGSGTGFVVSSDGFLVTCAHVVEGATKIDVNVAGQTFAGRVVAIDKPHDLAVVRVPAANLPIVPLANSDGVQLAQEVRAVGFPLSDVLGESVKITRGTIAGMVNSEGRKLFQVDASINPGNSGGPLVNEMGHVVGVASAKLAGEEIDGVGFAVVSNDILALLASQRVPFRAAQGGAKLDGPELARQVTPAVALIKVTIGPGGAGAAKRQTLEFNGHVTTKGQLTAGGRPVRGVLSRPQFENGKLQLTEFGEVIDATGSVQLPYLLGALGPLTIEPLSSGGERAWRTERVAALTQTIGEENPSNMPFHFRRPRGFRSPFAAQTAKVVITPAMETASYEILQTSGDLALIKKRYVFKTLQQQGAAPLAEITGEGTISFNQKGGFAEKFEYKANLVRSMANVTLTIPVTLAWNRATPEQLEDIKRRAAEMTQQRKEAEVKASQPPTEDELAQLLADLAPDQDFTHKYNALNSLKKMQPVDSQRAQLTKAIEPYLLDSNAGLRQAAIGVMGAWGTKENIPTLVKLLDQLDVGIRMAAIEALGKIKDPAAAEVLAPLIANSSDQFNATRALESLGGIAEPAVIKLLANRDNQVRYHAYRTLGKIGGRRSAVALKKRLQNESDGFAKAGGQAALRDLQRRGF